jgi:putative ABC transport system ATP-binding protein
LPNEGELAATCTGLVKIYWSGSGEVHALKGIDAAFPAGMITAVVGPSGSGKSSMLRILACVDRPTAGQVRVGGADVSGMSLRRRRSVRRSQVGYLFQRPSDNLVPYLTAIQQVELSAVLRGRADRREAAELLDTVGLAGREKHLPHQLSGGEQQRVAVAAAVVGSPALVVADEPTAELDSTSGATLMELLGTLADRGVGFVVATHDPVVMGKADRILSLRHGALEAETRADRSLSVIDAFGRIQLPPGALTMFPDRRAVITVDDGEVKITPP